MSRLGGETRYELGCRSRFPAGAVGILLSLPPDGCLGPTQTPVGKDGTKVKPTITFIQHRTSECYQLWFESEVPIYTPGTDMHNPQMFSWVSSILTGIWMDKFLKELHKPLFPYLSNSLLTATLHVQAVQTTLLYGLYGIIKLIVITRRCTHKVTLRCVHITIVREEKQ